MAAKIVGYLYLMGYGQNLIFANKIHEIWINFLFFFLVLFADVVGIIYSLCFTCCWYNVCLCHSDIGTRVIFNFEGFHDLIDCFIIIKFYISFFFSNAIRNGFCFRCFHFVSFVNTSLLLLGWSIYLLPVIEFKKDICLYYG